MDVDKEKEEQILKEFQKKQDEDRRRINKSNVKEAIRYELHVNKFILKTAQMFQRSSESSSQFKLEESIFSSRTSQGQPQKLKALYIKDLDPELCTQLEYLLYKWSFMFIERLHNTLKEKQQNLNYPIEGWEEFVQDSPNYSQYQQQIEAEYSKQRRDFQEVMARSEAQILKIAHKNEHIPKDHEINKNMIDFIIVNSLKQLFVSPALQNISYILKNQ